MDAERGLSALCRIAGRLLTPPRPQSRIQGLIWTLDRRCLLPGGRGGQTMGAWEGAGGARTVFCACCHPCRPFMPILPPRVVTVLYAIGELLARLAS